MFVIFCLSGVVCSTVLRGLFFIFFRNSRYSWHNEFPTETGITMFRFFVIELLKSDGAAVHLRV